MSGGTLLPLLRGLHLCAGLSLFGVLLFSLVILPAASAAPPGTVAALQRRLGGLVRNSAGFALLLGAAWFVAETASTAGVSGLGAVAGFLPVMALQTQFGGWLALRLGLLLVILLLPAHPVLRWPTLLLAGAAVAIQPMLAHAGAESGARGPVLVTGEELHLLAAGAWLGGLLPLWLSVRGLPVGAATRLCIRFSELGVVAVCLVALGGVLLAAAFVGRPAELVKSTYGELLLVKTGLFLLALIMAGLNRWVFTPALAAGDRLRLQASVAAESVIGLAIVLVAASLAHRMPGADMMHGMHGGEAAAEVAGLWRAALLGLGLGGACVLAAALWRRTILHRMGGL